MDTMTNTKSISRRLAAALGCGLLALAGGVWAGEIILTVENPAAGMPHAGIANLRGWVISDAGMKEVRLEVDGAPHSTLPLGGVRHDVAASYPDYPEADSSGFSIAYNFGNLSPGTHTMLFRAIDNDDEEKTFSVTFDTLRFHQPFFPDPAVVDYSQAGFVGAGSIIHVNGVVVDGVRYDATLSWQSESQQFQITAIAPSTN